MKRPINTLIRYYIYMIGLVLIIFPFSVFSKKKERITWSGFILNSAYVDSRQLVEYLDQLGSRQGYEFFLPKPIVEDVEGNDINARAQSNMMPIYSRLRATINGPDIGKAHCFGIMEADFLGAQEASIANLRLREMYIQLTMNRLTFLTGQTWHPMSFPSIAPDTISIEYGLPINPFNRSPQMRSMYQGEHYRVVGAVISQLLDANNGPYGRSGIYSRNAIFQDIAGVFIWYPKKHIHLGIGADYKRIMPRLVSNNNYKEHEILGSFSAIAYADLYYDDLRATTKIIYAENGDNLNLMGGYAVHSIDPITDKRTYTNLRTISCWFDIFALGKFQPGAFVGFIKNLGASKTIIPSIEQEGIIIPLVYGFATNVDTLFRFAPRIRILFEPFTFGFEVEYNRAAYGTINTFGEVINTRPVGSVRVLAGFYYFF